MDAASSAHERLIRRLECIAELSDEDKAALRRLPVQVKRLKAHAHMVVEGDQPTHCCLVVDGFMHRYKSLDEGKRVVLAYHMPGDIPDLQSLFLPKLDHTLGTVTACLTAMIPHAALYDLIRSQAGIAVAFWREALIQAALFRQWIVVLGGLPARSRLAHLICEIFDRLRAVGLTDNEGFPMPMTQVELAEATGMTAVHVNRSLQDLRADKLIVSEGRFLRIVDVAKLKAVAGYDPEYLQLRKIPRDA